MYARCLTTLTLLVFTTSLMASIELNTSIENVFYRGNNEPGGSITFTVVGDELSNASNASPVFIRITPDHNTRLANTLVEQASLDPTLNQPINLALRLVDRGATVVADPDAVSIVRWVAGESSFWVRVQQSSDEWLDNGAPVGPSVTLRVSWTIGTSARISDVANSKGDNANLPFNTRNSTANEGDFEDAVSTLLCIDLSNSNLQTDGIQESVLKYDVLALDNGVDLGNGVYSSSAGNQLVIGFSDNFSLARGQDRECALLSLAQSDGSIGAGTGTLQRFTKTMTIDHACTKGPGYLKSYLTPGTYLSITAQQPGFGFTATGARFTNGDGYVLVIPSSAIQIEGETLYSEIYLVWNDDTRDFTGSLPFELDLEYSGANVPEFELEITTFLSTGLDERDDAPYDGNDQNRTCEPSLAFIGSEIITLEQ